jgi:hypothetical protein
MTMTTMQQLRSEARQIGENIAELCATCVRIGERSDWRDAHIPAIERDIARLEAVRRDLLERASELAVKAA